jgi:hypothetical protein
MHIVAIVNPMSGAGMDPAVATRRVSTIRDELARRRLDGSVHLTERAPPPTARTSSSSGAATGPSTRLARG